MEPTADEIRHWLRDVLERTRQTPTDLARKAGVSPSTLTRFLTAEGAKLVLSFRTVTKVAHAAGIDPPMARTLVSPAIPGFSDVEGQRFDYDPDKPQKTRIEGAIAALVAARRAADPWLLNSRVVEDVGYLPGDVLIVDLNETPERGDVVCAQVYQCACHHSHRKPKCAPKKTRTAFIAAPPGTKNCTPTNAAHSAIDSAISDPRSVRIPVMRSISRAAQNGTHHFAPND